MKLSVDTKQLLSALHRLSLVVPKGAAAKIGVLGCVKLVNDGFGGLTIAGTDDHAVGRVQLDVDSDFEDVGTILPDFSRLLAVVESCPGSVVELSTPKPDKLAVRSGALRASLGLQEPDLYPTLPSLLPSVVVYAPALFPALARGVLMFNEKEAGDRGGSILWRVASSIGTVSATARTAGSLEDFPAATENTPFFDVEPERLLPKDWTILRSWSGAGAINGALAIEHAADDRWTFWAGSDWCLWFGKPEGSTAINERAFGNSGSGAEISPEALAAIKQGCEAVSGAVTNGRDAVVIVAGGPEGFSVKVRADDAVAWEDETPIPEINWSAGSAENLLKALTVLGEKEGETMLSMSPKGDGLRLERGGLVCLVAGFK